MNDVILSSIPLSSLREEIRAIFKEEIQQIKGNNISAKQYWTIKETADFCNTTVNTIHRYAKAGTLQKHHIGGRTLFKSEEVKAAFHTPETPIN